MRDVDEIIRRITGTHPVVKVHQLWVVHPGVDDDGLWFFQQPESECHVQIESSTGMCPFLVENDENNERFTAKSIDETVEIVTKLLHLT
jgi:hypothetical protein